MLKGEGYDLGGKFKDAPMLAAYYDSKWNLMSSGDKYGYPVGWIPSNFMDYFTFSITVHDAEGSGVGAVVSPVKATMADWFDITPPDYYKPNPRVIGIRPLKGLTITQAGSGYKRPVITISITGWPTWSDAYKNITGVFEFYRYSGSFQASATSAGFMYSSINVTDSTGSGAVLEPVFSQGKLTNVLIKNAGAGYSNPTATLVSNYGSGAQISLTVANAGDYPGCVSYFEQRRWFAGSRMRPQYIWATKDGHGNGYGLLPPVPKHGQNQG